MTSNEFNHVRQARVLWRTHAQTVAVVEQAGMTHARTAKVVLDVAVELEVNGQFDFINRLVDAYLILIATFEQFGQLGHFVEGESFN